MLPSFKNLLSLESLQCWHDFLYAVCYTRDEYPVLPASHNLGACNATVEYIVK